MILNVSRCYLFILLCFFYKKSIILATSDCNEILIFVVVNFQLISVVYQSVAVYQMSIISGIVLVVAFIKALRCFFQRI